MAQPTNEREIGKNSRNPNFLTVVIISAAALILIFIGAYFLVGDNGRNLVPPRHQDPQPTSQLSYPRSSTQYTSL